MDRLLHGESDPITYGMGFLDMPVEVVAEHLLEWRRERYPSAKLEHVTLPLDQALRRLEPLTIPPVRELIVQTDSNWCAYFDNGAQGGDPFGPVSFLAKQLKCRGVTMMDVPHTLRTNVGDAKGTYGALGFALYGPNDTDFLNLLRSVTLAYDTRWTFEALGIPQDFEDTSNYSKKRTCDRLSRETLYSYLEAMGIRPVDVAFYRENGYLIDINVRLNSNQPSIALDVAREKLGL